MIKGKVCIGIACYNEERYIKEAVLSALNQTFKDLKVIVSDNCSTDNTYDELCLLKDKYKNLEVVQQESNIGALMNFKYVLNKADGDYFMWMGGHDVLRPTCIEEAMKCFVDRSNVSLVYPLAQMIDENGEPMNIFPNSRIDTYQLSLYGRIKRLILNLSHCTAIYGLFPMEVAKNLPVHELPGTDYIQLYHVAFEGDIVQSQGLQFFRRQTRKVDRGKDMVNRQMDMLKLSATSDPLFLGIMELVKMIDDSIELKSNERKKLIRLLFLRFPKTVIKQNKEDLKRSFSEKRIPDYIRSLYTQNKVLYYATLQFLYLNILRSLKRNYNNSFKKN